MWVTRSAASLSSLTAFFAASLAFAVTPSNVLVLYNSASVEGTEVANYYAQLHPGVQLLGLSGVTSDEEVSADYYLGTIRPQILSALTPSIDAIVTTKGLPLRINTAPHTNPGTYTDPAGVSRNVFSTTWKPYSSLESELARIDTFSTWQQMGDQTYWLPPGSGYPHPSVNPYYKIAAPFSYAQYGTRLASRLDGFTLGQIKASLNRAQHAYGPVDNSAGPLTFVLDDDPGKNYDLMPALNSNVLAPRGLPYIYDNTSSFVPDSEGAVVGYVSHGRNQAATPPNYLVDQTSGIRFDLADGATFASWESFNAYSFDVGGNRNGQGLIAEWLARGGTAGVGNVEEPGASAANVVNEDQLFRMLLNGYTFAEAAWSATRQLSWVNTVVGDPLMVWKPFVLADMNGDESLNNIDIAGFELALTDVPRYHQLYPAVTNWELRADVNLDGIVDNRDIQPFEVRLTSIGSSDSGGNLTAIPEPSGLAIGLAACVALAAIKLRPRDILKRSSD